MAMEIPALGSRDVQIRVQLRWQDARAYNAFNFQTPEASAQKAVEGHVDQDYAS